METDTHLGVGSCQPDADMTDTMTVKQRLELCVNSGRDCGLCVGGSWVQWMDHISVTQKLAGFSADAAKEGSKSCAPRLSGNKRELRALTLE